MEIKEKGIVQEVQQNSSFLFHFQTVIEQLTPHPAIQCKNKKTFITLKLPGDQ